MSVILQMRHWCSMAALRHRVARARVLRLVVGAGGTRYRGWISTEHQQLDITSEASWARVFRPDMIDAVLAEHVYEHLSDSEIDAALRNVHRYLRRGGHHRIAVPDGNHMDHEYIATVAPGGRGAGSDDHRQLFNVRTLSACMERAGFAVRPLEWFDEEGEFHFREWSIEDGFVARSSRFDERNRHRPLAYTSLIIDACKE